MTPEQLYRALDAALQAQLDHLALVLLIVSAVGFVLIVWRLTPVLRDANQERRRMNEALNLIQIAILGEKESNDRQTAAIEALRQDLNNHIVTINLRFDQLPVQFREQLSAELAAHLTRRRGRWWF